MADEAQGTAAPATTTETTAAAAPEKPRVKADDLPPEALKARLDSAKEAARRELLSELGVADPKDAKAALAELKTRREAELSELERANVRVKELEGKAAMADAFGTVITNRATAELAALNEKARAFVTAEAGADPAKQLATIDRLRATGLLETAAPAVTPASAPAATAPATTAPRPAAPPEAGRVTQADARATYERLQTENPFAAAAFAERHAGDLFVNRST
jgi:hypothetical protein